MTVAADLAAIEADSTKTADEKRAARYAVKTTALLDVILNGKPAPQPIPPLVGRTFTLDGVSITAHSATALPNNRLSIDVTLDGKRNQYVITNPPVLPRVAVGNERQDMIQAASEMLASFPR